MEAQCALESPAMGESTYTPPAYVPGRGHDKAILPSKKTEPRLEIQRRLDAGDGLEHIMPPHCVLFMTTDVLSRLLAGKRSKGPVLRFQRRER